MPTIQTLDLTAAVEEGHDPGCGTTYLLNPAAAELQELIQQRVACGYIDGPAVYWWDAASMTSPMFMQKLFGKRAEVALTLEADRNAEGQYIISGAPAALQHEGIQALRQQGFVLQEDDGIGERQWFYTDIGHDRLGASELWWFAKGDIQTTPASRGYAHYDMRQEVGDVELWGRVDHSLRAVSYAYEKGVSPLLIEKVRQLLAKKWPGYKLAEYDPYRRSPHDDELVTLSAESRPEPRAHDRLCELRNVVKLPDVERYFPGVDAVEAYNLVRRLETAPEAEHAALFTSLASALGGYGVKSDHGIQYISYGDDTAPTIGYFKGRVLLGTLKELRRIKASIQARQESEQSEFDKAKETLPVELQAQFAEYATQRQGGGDALRTDPDEAWRLLRGFRKEQNLKEDVNGRVSNGVFYPGNSLGVARKDMPQLKRAVIDQFLRELDQEGVRYQLETVPVASLKPAQREVSLNVVDNTVQRHKAGEDINSNPLNVSKDDYIADGHNRWYAAYKMDPQFKLRIRRIDLPIRALLTRMERFGQEHGLAHKGLAQIGSTAVKESVDVRTDPDHDDVVSMLMHAPDGLRGVIVMNRLVVGDRAEVTHADLAAEIESDAPYIRIFIEGLNVYAAPADMARVKRCPAIKRLGLPVKSAPNMDMLDANDSVSASSGNLAEVLGAAKESVATASEIEYVQNDVLTPDSVYGPGAMTILVLMDTRIVDSPHLTHEELAAKVSGYKVGSPKLEDWTITHVEATARLYRKRLYFWEKPPEEVVYDLLRKYAADTKVYYVNPGRYESVKESRVPEPTFTIDDPPYARNVAVYKNPSRVDFIRVAEGSEYKSLRMLADKYGAGDVYVFDAGGTTHGIARRLIPDNLVQPIYLDVDRRSGKWEYCESDTRTWRMGEMLRVKKNLVDNPRMQELGIEASRFSELSHMSEGVAIYGGITLDDVTENPTTDDLWRLLRDAQMRTLRGVLQGDSLYVADAYACTHAELTRAIGASRTLPGVMFEVSTKGPIQVVFAGRESQRQYGKHLRLRNFWQRVAYLGERREPAGFTGIKLRASATMTPDQVWKKPGAIAFLLLRNGDILDGGSNVRHEELAAQAMEKYGASKAAEKNGATHRFDLWYDRNMLAVGRVYKGTAYFWYEPDEEVLDAIVRKYGVHDAVYVNESVEEADEPPVLGGYDRDANHSNRASDALSRGLVTSASLARRIGKGVDARHVEAVLPSREAHHFGGNFRLLAMYRDEDLTPEREAQIIAKAEAERKEREAGGFLADVEWLDWPAYSPYARRRQPPEQRSYKGARVQIKGQTATITHADLQRPVQKRLTTNGLRIVRRDGVTEDRDDVLVDPDREEAVSLLKRSLMKELRGVLVGKQLAVAPAGSITHWDLALVISRKAGTTGDFTRFYVSALTVQCARADLKTVKRHPGIQRLGFDVKVDPQMRQNDWDENSNESSLDDVDPRVPSAVWAKWLEAVEANAVEKGTSFEGWFAANFPDEFAALAEDIVHAPAGGTTVGGKQYKGGQFTPGKWAASRGVEDIGPLKRSARGKLEWPDKPELPFRFATLFDPADLKLSDTAVASYQSEDDAYQRSTAAFPTWQVLLNLGKGVVAELGDKARDIYLDSPEKMAKLGEMLDEPGPLVVIGGLKGRRRAQEKVSTKYRGDWSRLHDIVRATVAVDSFDEVPLVVAAVQKHMQKNGWSFSHPPEDRFTQPTKDGYMDAVLKLRSPNGVIAELQINVKSMLKAKEGLGRRDTAEAGHLLYERVRTIAAKLKSEKRRKMTPEEHVEVVGLRERMKIMYAKAFARAVRPVKESLAGAF